ncbi:4Fe-4S dicluster domain-containing protein, partial [Phocaeicola sp. ICN-14070]|uniref:4Fe-4S dicluster domain-containing protein n=1 Tax=Phocaeicola sp. ICN-14070 TaxID=3134656 RepID=UPI0030BD1396
MEICPQNICTGCQACRMSCKHSAIQMVENEKGNIYPIINEEKCTGCQRCINTCPALHPISTNNQKQPRVFAGWTKNGKQRKRSTSGGLSFVISKHIVKNKGIFCGVIWTEQGAEHQICEDISMLNKFQGSKYAHSDVRNTYIEIQNLLKTGKKVLFTGTPCQVAGLKNFLRKEYDN